MISFISRKFRFWLLNQKKRQYRISGGSGGRVRGGCVGGGGEIPFMLNEQCIWKVAYSCTPSFILGWTLFDLLIFLFERHERVFPRTRNASLAYRIPNLVSMMSLVDNRKKDPIKIYFQINITIQNIFWGKKPVKITLFKWKNTWVDRWETRVG